MNRSSLLSGVLASSFLLTACGGAREGDASTCDPTQGYCPPVQATPPPCASSTVALPPVGGFTGSVTVNAPEYNNESTCLLPVSISSSLPSGFTGFTPPANGKTLLYFAISSSTTQDIFGYPGVSINVPAGTIVSGRSFYVVANYYGNAWFAAFGPMHVAGDALSGGNIGNEVWNIAPGFPMAFALYSVGP